MKKLTQFRVEYDTRSDEIIDDISCILRNEFGLDITVISGDDDEFIEYEIVKL